LILAHLPGFFIYGFQEYFIINSLPAGLAPPKSRVLGTKAMQAGVTL
jgi:hypothetical protein